MVKNGSCAWGPGFVDVSGMVLGHVLVSDGWTSVCVAHSDEMDTARTARHHVLYWGLVDGSGLPILRCVPGIWKMLYVCVSE